MIIGYMVNKNNIDEVPEVGGNFLEENKDAPWISLQEQIETNE